MKQLFVDLWTAILQRMPGGDLRRCPNISLQNTKCLRRYNHLGRCEDAWKYRWRPTESL